MNKRYLSILILIVLGIGSMLFLQGCDTEETLTPQDFAPQTNFRALSLSGAVVLYWTRSTADGVADFAGYRVQTYNSSNTKIDSFLTTNDSARITGLVNNDWYAFTIRSVKSDGDVSVQDSILWGPTQRFLPVTIYEYDSPNPSGLRLSTGNSFPFTSTPTDNRSNIDLWVDGRGDADMLLKSPSDEDFASSDWRVTKLYETTATSLDQQVNFPSLSAFRTNPGFPIVVGKVYLAYTQDGHYSRFQVTAIDNVSANNRSVSILIAYNAGDGAWAKK